MSKDKEPHDFSVWPKSFKQGRSAMIPILKRPDPLGAKFDGKITGREEDSK